MPVKKLFLLTLVIFSGVVLSGCLRDQSSTVAPDENTTTDDTQTSPSNEETFPQKTMMDISLKELNTHNNADNCWLAIDGKVYDVTEFIASHPGGQAILEGCGMDATQLFETRPMGSQTPHSATARARLPQYEIGVLE